MGREVVDVAVVGAGAAGLMAAIFASRTAVALGRDDFRVVALDGATRLGAKILVSGGGRCNVTNEAVESSDFNGSNRNLVARVLRTFGVTDTIRFFEEAGVTLVREESGKLFPATNRARTVLDALLETAQSSGAEVRSAARVTDLVRNHSRWTLETGQGLLEARCVVIATGGRSLPKSGSDGGGYKLAQSFGHSVGETFPALVPLLLTSGSEWLKQLTGLAVPVELELRSGRGKVLLKLRGPILMTHFGISGPVVLDMSRHWVTAQQTDSGAGLVVSFKPGARFEQLEKELQHRAATQPRQTCASVLREFLPARLAEALLVHAANVPLELQVARVSREERRAIVRALIELPLTVSGTRGFNFAEVTAGGIPLQEIETATMQSKASRGLFLCGEILDVDGRIGGFNFQWAWASGRLAGIHAAEAALPTA